MKPIIPKLHIRTDFGSYSRRSIFHSLLYKFNRRLTNINQQAPEQNLGTSLLLLSGITLLGALYFIFAYGTFKGLWYHKILCILSTLIFIYLCEQSYFEVYEKRIRRDLPGTLKKLTHYYNHYKGNIIPAMEDTIGRCPKSNRIYILKMKEALSKPDYEKHIEALERQMPVIWLKMLCRLVLFAKENGGEVHGSNGKSVEGDVISSNLKRLTNIVTFLNIEQGYNDAELLGMQVFVLFSPFFVIPVTRWYNASLLIDFNIGDIYNSIQAQSLTAVMLFISGFGALFIHWMRKLQN